MASNCSGLHLKSAVRSFSSAHRVWRWGAGGGGAVNSSEGEISKTPTLVENFNNISFIATGKDHSAFVSQGIILNFNKIPITIWY